MTRTRADALEGAARCIVEGLRVSDSLPIEEAARRAMQAGGPSYEEHLNIIRARRARLGLLEDRYGRARCPRCDTWYDIETGHICPTGGAAAPHPPIAVVDVATQAGEAA